MAFPPPGLKGPSRLGATGGGLRLLSWVHLCHNACLSICPVHEAAKTLAKAARENPRPLSLPAPAISILRLNDRVALTAQKRGKDRRTPNLSSLRLPGALRCLLGAAGSGSREGRRGRRAARTRARCPPTSSGAWIFVAAHGQVTWIRRLPRRRRSSSAMRFVRRSANRLVEVDPSRMLWLTSLGELTGPSVALTAQASCAPLFRTVCSSR